jgi:hypothetical protein
VTAIVRIEIEDDVGRTAADEDQVVAGKIRLGGRVTEDATSVRTVPTRHVREPPRGPQVFHGDQLRRSTVIDSTAEIDSTVEINSITKIT